MLGDKVQHDKSGRYGNIIQNKKIDKAKVIYKKELESKDPDVVKTNIGEYMSLKIKDSKKISARSSSFKKLLGK